MTLPRRTLGPYRVAEVISRTGSAVLYKGYHPDRERWNVIRIVRFSPRPSPQRIIRFEQVMQRATCLRHPNVLSVLDYGCTARFAYTVSDYVPASTLKRRLAFGLNLRAVLSMTLQLADALSHAHAHGVIHGGITPSNILLGIGDWPLLTDFGLTVLLHGDRVQKGDRFRISPEQRQGLSLDHRTDVYALGAVLYEVLTGTAPFDDEGDPAETLPSPSVYQPGIPREVEAIVLQAMACNPNRRYRHMKDLVNDLRTVHALLFGQDALPEWPMDGRTDASSFCGSQVHDPHSAYPCSQNDPAVVI